MGDDDAETTQRDNDAFDNFPLWNIVRIGIGVALLVGFAFLVNLFVGGPYDAPIIGASRVGATTIELGVDACNQGEITTSIERNASDVYTIKVQTEERPNTLDCAAVVVVDIASLGERVVVVDATSGNRFDVDPFE